MDGSIGRLIDHTHIDKFKINLINTNKHRDRCWKGSKVPSLVVRTVPMAMDGGTDNLEDKSSDCRGERPRNSTRPVSKW